MSPTSAQSVSIGAARQLTTTVKTPPQMVGVTPRWLLRLLPWVNVPSGTYRVNRRNVIVQERARVALDVKDGVAVVTFGHLRAVPLLAEAPDDLLAAIAERFRSVQLAPGESVVREGDAGNDFFIIAEGTVEVTKESAAGIELRVNVLGEGEFFGELALITDGRRDATVRAVTPCVMAALGRADFEQLLEGAPDLREHLLEMVERHRANRARANEYGEAATALDSGHGIESTLPRSFVEYDEHPREYPLDVVQTIVSVHTRITDLYNDPIDQLTQQLRLTIESMREQQEMECINNPSFGLLHNVGAGQRVRTRNGPPTPDDLDELLARVWKEPSFFLAHPRAVAAFGRECTRRGVPPPTVALGASQTLTWRGVPIVPCDKLLVNGRTRPMGRSGLTNILLVRTGEHNGGVVGLHQTGIAGEHLPSLTVRLMSITTQAIAEYLVSLYFSVAALREDAIACLESVEVGNFYSYA